ARLTARLRPFLQPRFAMGMAMTILSFSMLARFAGIGPRQIHPQELNPIRLWQALDDTAHRTWDRARKFYLSLRLVYEIQTQLREWYQQIPSQAGPPSPLPTQQEPNDRDLPPDPPPGRSAVSSPGSPKIGTGDTKP
ncbi:MAG: hypothetical protein NZ554_01285, partial [Bryobacteraceae bacterium]|nr:hypothetical protein [Bryobacteraceae bacterium]